MLLPVYKMMVKQYRIVSILNLNLTKLTQIN